MDVLCDQVFLQCEQGRREPHASLMIWMCSSIHEIYALFLAWLVVEPLNMEFDAVVDEDAIVEALAIVEFIE